MPRGRPRKIDLIQEGAAKTTNGALTFIPYKEGEEIPIGENRYFFKGNSLVRAFRKQLRQGQVVFCTRNVMTFKDKNQKSKLYLRHKAIRKKMVKAGIPGA